jgi:glycosyltransferase involved in cell wall biosynthesis
MAAYNAETYIAAAIRSILNQTYVDWELIVIDDASKDQTVAMVNRLADQDDRIKLIAKEQNTGVVDTRNIGIQSSKGKYLAILDSDDIAYPKRLELQLEFMEQHPDHVLVGGECWEIDSQGNPLKKIDRLIPNEQLSTLLLFSNYFINSTVMIRKSALDLPAYHQGFQPSEDYELFCRLGKKGNLANLKTPLAYYRIHDQNISGDSAKLSAAIKEIHRKYLDELGLKASEEELKLHSQLTEGPFPRTLAELKKVNQWLLKLLKQNELHTVYPDHILRDLIKRFFMRSCAHSQLGIKAIRFYFDSDISEDFCSDIKGNLIFIMKSLFRQYGNP